jgi:hypothetical protein
LLVGILRAHFGFDADGALVSRLNEHCLRLPGPCSNFRPGMTSPFAVNYAFYTRSSRLIWNWVGFIPCCPPTWLMKPWSNIVAYPDFSSCIRAPRS